MTRIDPSTSLTLFQAIGVLRFASESHAPGHQAFAMALVELDRLKAMERRLIEWAEEFDRDATPGSVGPFIGAELRNRMTGDANGR